MQRRTDRVCNPARLARPLSCVARLPACGSRDCFEDNFGATLNNLRNCRLDPPPRNPAVQVPSVFTGRTPSETVVQFYSNGFINELPTPQQQNLNAGCCTAGLMGANVELGGKRTFGNLVACVRNDNCVDRAFIGPNRTPSRFCATTARGAAAQCVEQGWILDAPTPQQAQLNAGRGTAGLMGDNVGLGGKQTFGDLCIKKRFWGL